MRPILTFYRYLLMPVGIIILSLSACEKEVHINLGTSPTQLVVQGAIESGQPPYVFLTKTIGFFSNVDLKTMQNSFIHSDSATVQVSDGSKTIKLREYSFDTGANAKFYIYTIDTSNLSNLIIGQLNTTYTLTITYGAKTYTSVTKIPNVKGPDSLWFAQPIFTDRKTPATAMELFANYTDPDTPGNYVRYFTKRNNQLFYPSGIFTDEVVNGKQVTNIPLFGGFDDSTNVKHDSLIYFYPGDTVTVKWSEIDKKVYDFWNSYQFAQSSVGNPFASPINLKTNISNGGLGVWAGYGNWQRTVIVPR